MGTKLYVPMPDRTIEVEAGSSGDSTEVRLDVDGLLPNRGYAAHAHVKPCGTTGADAGPHIQNTDATAAGPDAATARRSQCDDPMVRRCAGRES